MKIDSNKMLQASRILFKDGTQLTDIECYISDRFIIAESSENITLYNTDTICRIELAERTKPEKNHMDIPNVWY